MRDEVLLRQTLQPSTMLWHRQILATIHVTHVCIFHTRGSLRSKMFCFVWARKRANAERAADSTYASRALLGLLLRLLRSPHTAE